MDNYYVDNVNDSVEDVVEAGVPDWIYTSVDYTLAVNVEVIVALHGSGATLRGNDDSNFLVSSNDGSVNHVYGAKGNDGYAIHPYDFVHENVGEGIDTVNIWGDYTLPDNVEELILGGPGAYYGTGNALDNQIVGNALSNTLDGGAGADNLIGGAGSDTYYAGRGGGADTVVETVADGDTDVLQFLAGVATNQIWFRQVASDLEASIIGTSDKVKLQGWYGGGGHAVEQFKTSDGGKTLLESQVQGLVSAMAALSATPPATSTLPTDASYDSLRLMIATNWQ